MCKLFLYIHRVNYSATTCKFGANYFYITGVYHSLYSAVCVTKYVQSDVMCHNKPDERFHTECYNGFSVDYYYYYSSNITAPQDAHTRLVLKVFSWLKHLEFSAISS